MLTEATTFFFKPREKKHYDYQPIALPDYSSF